MIALITGGYGFIGRNISLEYHKNGYSVVGVGLEPEDKGFSALLGIDVWHECNIADLSELGDKYKFDTIVHCAGGSSVGYAASHPEEDFDNTVRGTLSVLQYIREFQPTAKLIYLSSAAVYGNSQNLPIKENAPLNPISNYGLHKKLAEELCLYYSENYEIQLNIVRIFSAYGSGLKKQLLWDACNKISRGENMFYGNGDEIRDWIHVGDIAKAIYFIGATSVEEKILNLASGSPVTTKEILEMTAEEINSSSKPTFNGIENTGNPKHYLADIDLLRSYGWIPTLPLKDGVKNYVEWYKSQQND